MPYISPMILHGARIEDLENLLNGLMQVAPPDSIGLVDTMGCALPQTIMYLVRKIKRMTGLPVEVHTHNDFGMAVCHRTCGSAAALRCFMPVSTDWVSRRARPPWKN